MQLIRHVNTLKKVDFELQQPMRPWHSKSLVSSSSSIHEVNQRPQISLLSSVNGLFSLNYNVK
ncbi:hypothetical protein NC651_021023 [Populus alba x Populus x berolinensis]|nr:hypothetical protein NC651_021023 [Populus alba x Populus x berolinensis]